MADNFSLVLMIFEENTLKSARMPDKMFDINMNIEAALFANRSKSYVEHCNKAQYNAKLAFILTIIFECKARYQNRKRV